MIKERKYDLIGIGLIVLLFIGSILVRKENLSSPLSRHHEWITAHSLITVEIWDQNGGPSAYGFNPVYTYKGTGNSYRPMLGGISNKNGDVFYVSYPPFTFIFAYYFNQILGGPSVINMRIISLTIHLIASLLMFYLMANLRPEPERKSFNFVGVIAAGLYLFARGNLWFHGNLYFADMLVQPLFFGGLLLTIRYYNGTYRSERLTLTLLSIVFFLATYTEWIGLFTAFFTGFAFLLLAILRKEKRFFKPFILLALGSSLALGLTLYQYASIDGWESFRVTSEKKYAERSGHGTTQGSAAQFNIHNKESLDHMAQQFHTNYKSIESYFAFTLGILILALLFRKIKPIKNEDARVFPNAGNVGFLLTLTLLPILTHYLLFYNFNTVHDFSGIKTSGLLIFITAFALQIIYRVSKQTHRYYAIGILAFFSVLFLIKSKESVERYQEFHTTNNIDWDRINSALKIAAHSEPDAAVFTNVRFSPEQVYYSKHSISPIPDGDTTTLKQIMELFDNDKSQYYYHDGSKLKSMVNIELQGQNLVLLDTIVFN